MIYSQEEEKEEVQELKVESGRGQFLKRYMSNSQWYLFNLVAYFNGGSLLK